MSSATAAPFADLARRLGADPEFAVTARLWTATVCLRVDGVDVAAVRVDRGTAIDLDPAAPGPVDVRIAAPEAAWAELLAPVPRPFFQDLFPAMVHHGVVVEGEPEDWWAHYRVLQRVLEILRGV
jgi:hypothetical protein